MGSDWLASIVNTGPAAESAAGVGTGRSGSLSVAICFPFHSNPSVTSGARHLIAAESVPRKSLVSKAGACFRSLAPGSKNQLRDFSGHAMISA
jgi:hypothetical protein